MNKDTTTHLTSGLAFLILLSTNPLLLGPLSTTLLLQDGSKHSFSLNGATWERLHSLTLCFINIWCRHLGPFAAQWWGLKWRANILARPCRRSLQVDVAVGSLCSLNRLQDWVVVIGWWSGEGGVLKCDTHPFRGYPWLVGTNRVNILFRHIFQVVQIIVILISLWSITSAKGLCWCVC